MNKCKVNVVMQDAKIFLTLKNMFFSYYDSLPNPFNSNAHVYAQTKYITYI